MAGFAGRRSPVIHRAICIRRNDPVGARAIHLRFAGIAGAIGTAAVAIRAAAGEDVASKGDTLKRGWIVWVLNG